MLNSFLKYYKPYKKKAIFIVLGSLTMAVLDLIFPIIVRNILNVAIPNNKLDEIYHSAGILVLLYLCNAMVTYLVNYYGHAMSVMVEKDMRKDLLRHIENMSFSFFDHNKTGQLVSRLTSDLTEVGELVFRAPNDVIVCLVSMLGSITIMFHINALLGGLVTVLLLLKTIHTIFINRKMKKAFRTNRIKNGELTAKINELLSGIRLVKAFSTEEYELNDAMKINDECVAVRNKSFKILGYFSASVNFFTNIINLAVLVYGSILILNGNISISDFIAFLLYINLFMKPLLRLTVFTEVYQRGMAGFSRFYEILNVPVELKEDLNFINDKPIEGSITIKNLSFGYNDDKLIIKNMNLYIKKGEKVAFVGMTGAGKTTIANLLLRFYDPQKGQILIDDIDIKKYPQKYLRKNIGLVQQDVFLFSDSVKHNIMYGSFNLNDNDIKNAAQHASATEFIEKLPDDFHTEVGERGIKLSGGQKQRLAIARVFAKNPPIVILDEATSSLDNRTEKNIQEALDKLSAGRTTIIIAHRLSTIKNADRIIVLGNGEIIEQGNHEELYGRRGYYYKLYNSM